MKTLSKIFSLVLFLCLATIVQAQVEVRREKNLSTRIVFPIRNVSTGALITGATALDCETSSFADSSNPTSFADVTNAEAEIGTTGMYYFNATAAEMNFDMVIFKCTSSSTNAATTLMLVNTLHGTIITDSSGGLGSAAEADVLAQANTALDTAVPSSPTANSINARIKTLTDARGTAQSATSTTLVLAASEAFGDNELRNNSSVVIVSATTGALQTRCILSNVGSTDTVTVAAWDTTPTGTITYDLISTPNCQGNVTQWNGTAVATPDTAGYVKATIKDGTGTGEIDTSSGTVIAGTVSDKTGYRLSATGVDDVWDEAQSGHTTAGTFGKYLDAQVSTAGGGGGGDGGDAFREW